MENANTGTSSQRSRVKLWVGCAIGIRNRRVSLKTSRVPVLLHYNGYVHGGHARRGGFSHGWSGSKFQNSALLAAHSLTPHHSRRLRSQCAGLRGQYEQGICLGRRLDRKSPGCQVDYAPSRAAPPAIGGRVGAHLGGWRAQGGLPDSSQGGSEADFAHHVAGYHIQE